MSMQNRKTTVDLIYLFLSVSLLQTVSGLTEGQISTVTYTLLNVIVLLVISIIKYLGKTVAIQGTV